MQSVRIITVINYSGNYPAILLNKKLFLILIDVSFFLNSNASFFFKDDIATCSKREMSCEFFRYNNRFNNS